MPMLNIWTTLGLGPLMLFAVFLLVLEGMLNRHNPWRDSVHDAHRHAALAQAIELCMGICVTAMFLRAGMIVFA